MRERKRILLIGAGHAHIVALRRLAKRGPNAEIIFVNDTPHAWYTGALPALIRGGIKPEQARVDLQKLAARTGVILKTAIYDRHCERSEAIHPSFSRPIIVHFKNHTSIDCDILSLSIGGPQAAHGIKPIPEFLRRLAQWETEKKPKIGIIGSGAAGIEIALALRVRLGPTAELYVQSRDGTLLPGAPPKAQKVAAQALQNANINIFQTLQQGLDIVTAFTPEPTIKITETFALAPSTSLRAEGSNPSLEDRKAFIFVTGDNAIFPCPLPRSGAIAARQGRTLAYNLTHNHPKMFAPPAATLAILSVNSRQAIAWYGKFSWVGRLPMLLKKYLDKNWVS